MYDSICLYDNIWYIFFCCVWYLFCCVNRFGKLLHNLVKLIHHHPMLLWQLASPEHLLSPNVPVLCLFPYFIISFSSPFPPLLCSSSTVPSRIAVNNPFTISIYLFQFPFLFQILFKSVLLLLLELLHYLHYQSILLSLFLSIYKFQKPHSCLSFLWSTFHIFITVCSSHNIFQSLSHFQTYYLKIVSSSIKCLFNVCFYGIYMGFLFFL